MAIRTSTISVDLTLGKTFLIPHPEKVAMYVMSAAFGWKQSPTQRIPLVSREQAVGHFRGKVTLPKGTLFRLMITNIDPADPGMAYKAGDYWWSLERYQLAPDGVNSVV